MESDAPYEILLELQVTEQAISVFLSYSRKDKDMLDKLITHLAGLRRTGKITTWHDRDIEAGNEWEPELLEKLDTADIILLLISAEFIDSDYCYGKELQRAIERHNEGEARVIPVILKPCLWNLPTIPFSILNVLPNDALPITKWKDPDEAFTVVVESIYKIANPWVNECLQREEIQEKDKLDSLKQTGEEKQQQEYSKVTLSSKKGIKYTNLEDLLSEKLWKAADQETYKLMKETMNRQDEQGSGYQDIEKFPCIDLQTIDKLWVKYSKGKFGFTVQQKIWERFGSPMNPDDNWDKFAQIVGWKKRKWYRLVGYYLEYDELLFSIENSPMGELPIYGINVYSMTPYSKFFVVQHSRFLSRLKTCNF